MDKDNQLQRLHEVLLEILTEFDRICRKHNIQYFLDSGTALGAVRHGGFIPWDDDIDVGMLRSEYDRFMEVAPKEIGEKFYLQHRGVDSSYKKNHAKLRKLGTEYPEEGTENLICKGIFIDIFPFDYISDNTTMANVEFWLNRKLYNTLRLKRSSRHYSNPIVKFFNKVIKLLPFTFYESLYCRFQILHNSKKTKTVTCYNYKMVLKRNILFPEKAIYPSRDIIFAGRTFSIMNDTHEYLTRMYGNYMELPPESQREYHITGNILF